MNHSNKRQPAMNHESPRKSEPCPPTQRRVAVDFLPHRGWQAEIGQRPAPVASTRSARRDIARDIAPVTGYNRPRGDSRLPHVFVPLELVIAAEKQRADRRQASCRVAPKSPLNL